MNKIVINKCYGGFSLSEAAVLRYAEIKGLTLYPEPSTYGEILGPTYWLVPPEKRIGECEGEAWAALSMAERIAWNETYAAQVLNYHNIPRTDPALVQVVEELGTEASGRFADLHVVEFEGNRYRLGEYDGTEWIETPDSIEWVVI